jgi:hypothetical protein
VDWRAAVVAPGTAERKERLAALTRYGAESRLESEAYGYELLSSSTTTSGPRTGTQAR